MQRLDETFTRVCMMNKDQKNTRVCSHVCVHMQSNSGLAKPYISKKRQCACSKPPLAQSKEATSHA